MELIVLCLQEATAPPSGINNSAHEERWFRQFSFSCEHDTYQMKSGGSDQEFTYGNVSSTVFLHTGTIYGINKGTRRLRLQEATVPPARSKSSAHGERWFRPFRFFYESDVYQMESGGTWKNLWHPQCNTSISTYMKRSHHLLEARAPPIEKSNTY